MKKLLALFVVVLCLLSNSISVKAVNIEPLQSQMEQKYVIQIEKKVNSSPSYIQNSWDTYINNIKFISTKQESGIAAFSYTNGITLNIKKDASRTFKTQSKYKYSETFHEVGHFIAYSLSDDFTNSRGSSISESYISKKYNCTLTDMLKREGNAYYKKVKVTAGKNAWKTIKKELRNYDSKDSYEVSDIWDGISNGKAYAYCAHSISAYYPDYWTDTPVGTEAFADMYEACILNKNGVKLIKKYFPKSFEIFEEELNLTSQALSI